MNLFAAPLRALPRLLPRVPLPFFIAIAVTAATAQPLEFRFAWPPSGLRLKVDGEYQRESALHEQPDATSSQFSFVWVFDRRGDDGFALTAEDFTLVRSEPARSLDPLVRLEHAAVQAAFAPPPLLVNAAGQVTGVDGIEEARRAFEGKLAAIDLAADPAAQQVRQRLIAPEAFAQRAAEDWDRMVSIWTRTTELSFDEPVFESVMDELDGGRTYERQVELRSFQTRSSGRVTLQVLERLLPEDLEKVAGDMLEARWLGQLRLKPGETVEMETTYSTETEVQTLIPVRYRKVRDIVVTTADGETNVISRQSWTWTFQRLHEDEPPPPPGATVQ